MKTFRDIAGFNVVGCPFGAIGFIAGERQGDWDSEIYSEVLQFDHYSNMGIPNNPFSYQTFLDGEPAEFVDKENLKQITVPTKNGAFFEFDVLPVLSSTESTLFHTLPVGQRVLITIDESTADDFYAYEIYSDLGLGGAYSLLTTLIGVSNNVYLTSELTAGATYNFKVAALDQAGNRSEYSGVSSVVISKYQRPVQYTDFQWRYSPSARNVGVEAVNPATQIDDHVGFRVYMNHIPTQTDHNNLYLNQNKLYPVTTVYFAERPGGVIWQSQTLTKGVWTFGIAPITKYGVEQEITQQTFVLVADGTDLVESETVTTIPLKPIDITAEIKAGGDIDITVDYNYQAGMSIAIYENWTRVSETAQTAGGTTTITRSGLADGIYFYCASSFIELDGKRYESASTYVVYVNADSTAPDAPTFICELVI